MLSNGLSAVESQSESSLHQAKRLRQGLCVSARSSPRAQSVCFAGYLYPRPRPTTIGLGIALLDLIKCPAKRENSQDRNFRMKKCQNA